MSFSNDNLYSLKSYFTRRNYNNATIYIKSSWAHDGNQNNTFGESHCNGGIPCQAMSDINLVSLLTYIQVVCVWLSYCNQSTSDGWENNEETIKCNSRDYKPVLRILGVCARVCWCVCI